MRVYNTHRLMCHPSRFHSQGYPHEGVRPFHESQLASTQLTLGSYEPQMWSRIALKCRGDESRVLHRVEGTYIPDIRPTGVIIAGQKEENDPILVQSIHCSLSSGGLGHHHHHSS